MDNEIYINVPCPRLLSVFIFTQPVSGSLHGCCLLYSRLGRSIGPRALSKATSFSLNCCINQYALFFASQLSCEKTYLFLQIQIHHKIITKFTFQFLALRPPKDPVTTRSNQSLNSSDISRIGLAIGKPYYHTSLALVNFRSTWSTSSHWSLQMEQVAVGEKPLLFLSMLHIILPRLASQVKTLILLGSLIFQSCIQASCPGPLFLQGRTDWAKTVVLAKFRCLIFHPSSWHKTLSKMFLQWSFLTLPWID